MKTLFERKFFSAAKIPSIFLLNILQMYNQLFNMINRSTVESTTNALTNAESAYRAITYYYFSRAKHNLKILHFRLSCLSKDDTETKSEELVCEECLRRLLKSWRSFLLQLRTPVRVTLTIDPTQVADQLSEGHHNDLGTISPLTLS